MCASPAFSLHPSHTPPRSQPVDVKPGVYPGLQTCTYCDMPFVKWAVNSGRIALQHPVLWRFVSATIPTKAAVKISPHGKAGVMKQSVCFFVFLLRANRSHWHFLCLQSQRSRPDSWFISYRLEVLRGCQIMCDSALSASC